MKNWLKENKFIIILLVITLGSAFYWYEWRPSKTRERCYAEAEFDRRSSLEFNDEVRNKFIDDYYRGCLKRFGLDK